MKVILFRCDASLSIGSGHIIRCRTLARVLKQRGAAITFLCRRQSGDLISLLEKEFHVLHLPEHQLACCDGLAGRELYEAWLGCSQYQDADDCLKSLAQANISKVNWLVVDHYGLGAIWEEKLLSGLVGDIPTRLLAIDDLADRPHQADLLLDQNFFGESTKKRYLGLIPEHCLKLLGPHYALLGPEYAQLHSLVPPRIELKRVLVFFGGVDSMNLTSLSLQALCAPVFADLAVDVVIGLQSTYRREVEELVARRPNTTLHDPLPSLAALIARADLAIGAGGATTWERACLGLPSLVITLAANQVAVAEALHWAGEQQFLGTAESVCIDQIRQSIGAAIQESWPRACGHHLTDGWGAVRLATSLLGVSSPMQLQSAKSSDEVLLFQCTNHRLLGQSCLSTELIDSESQRSSFLSGLTDPERLILIVRDAHGCPLAQIRFDRIKPELMLKTPYKALIDVSSDSCVTCKGFEGELIRMGLYEMERQWCSMSEDKEKELCLNPFLNQATFSVAKTNVRTNTTNKSFPELGVDKSRLNPSYITLLSDTGSWINDYLPPLIKALWLRGHAVRWIHNPLELNKGDICLMLSCGRLLSSEQLALHRHNLVVHASALPLGQGWSPMTWQILEGSHVIPITLFEATAKLDAGDIYLQRTIQLDGTELVDEWRKLQLHATMSMCLEFFDSYVDVFRQSRPQEGKATSYKRRGPTDSILDPEHSILDHFDLLRVVDNQRYPATFQVRGKQYKIHISGSED
jgi:UDP-2,4-diacetamido-2,4,6-trideoxy-beta-L-altropyranose hydrolase